MAALRFADALALALPLAIGGVMTSRTALALAATGAALGRKGLHRSKVRPLCGERGEREKRERERDRERERETERERERDIYIYIYIHRYIYI